VGPKAFTGPSSSGPHGSVWIDHAALPLADGSASVACTGRIPRAGTGSAGVLPVPVTLYHRLVGATPAFSPFIMRVVWSRRWACIYVCGPGCEAEGLGNCSRVGVVLGLHLLIVIFPRVCVGFVGFGFLQRVVSVLELMKRLYTVQRQRDKDMFHQSSIAFPEAAVSSYRHRRADVHGRTDNREECAQGSGPAPCLPRTASQVSASTVTAHLHADCREHGTGNSPAQHGRQPSPATVDVRNASASSEQSRPQATYQPLSTATDLETLWLPCQSG
jgi:nitrate reductase NapE component